MSIGALPGARWFVLCRYNPAASRVIDGVRFSCPESITPVSINTNLDYLKALQRNGGDYRIIEVTPTPGK